MTQIQKKNVKSISIKFMNVSNGSDTNKNKQDMLLTILNSFTNMQYNLSKLVKLIVVVKHKKKTIIVEVIKSQVNIEIDQSKKI